ncbi:MAG: lipoprotein [Pseudomonadota bacterium]|uniref:LPS translocon maturation chaperone LptM n=1 Tax=Tepidimonas thermarum TaxID=335431 RepID=UPI003470652E
MPPTRWLSMSASVVSLRRSQLSSTALRAASARSRYSRSVIARIAAMPSIRAIVGGRAWLLVAVWAMSLSGCGQKGPLVLPPAPADSPPAATTTPHAAPHAPR